MNLILHHLRKDIRALRWMLLLWLLLIALELVINKLTFQSDYDLAHQAEDLRTSPLLIFFHGLLWAALLVRLIQTEPVTGSTSFWLTRPVPPYIQLPSKLLFILILVIGPGLLPGTLYLVQLHAAPESFWVGLYAAFLLQVAYLIAVLWLATFTKSVVQFVGVVSLVVVSIVLWMATTMLRAHAQLIAPDGLLMVTRMMLFIYLFFPGLTLSLWIQHVLRRGHLGLSIGLAAIVLAVAASWCPVKLPILFPRGHSNVTSPGMADVLLPPPKDVAWSYVQNSDKVIAIVQLVPVQRPADGWAAPSWVKAEFQVPGEKAVTLATDDEAVKLSFQSNAVVLGTNLLPSKLPGVRFAPNELEGTTFPVTLFSLESSLKNELRNKTGLLTLEVGGNMTNLQQLAALPLGQPGYIAYFPGGYVRAKVEAGRITLWSVQQGKDTYAPINGRRLVVLVDPNRHQGTLLHSGGLSSMTNSFASFPWRSSEEAFDVKDFESLSEDIVYFFEPKQSAVFSSTVKLPVFRMSYK